jgi:hypothetical protein
MARRPPPEAPKRHAQLRPEEIGPALAALRKKKSEVEAAAIPGDTRPEDIPQIFYRLCARVASAYRDIFGEDTIEADDARHFSYNWSEPGWNIYGQPAAHSQYIESFENSKRKLAGELQTAIEVLEDKQNLFDAGAAQKALTAYNNLELHPQIADAASDLYRDGHYANAIEDSVKALNNLVRMKSKLDIDGEALMNKAFSPNDPLLRWTPRRTPGA